MSNGAKETETPELPPAVIAALTNGRMVEAVKLLREARGIGLKEAKDALDDYIIANPGLRRKLEAQRAEAMRGGMLWLAALIALATIGWFVVAAK